MVLQKSSTCWAGRPCALARTACSCGWVEVWASGRTCTQHAYILHTWSHAETQDADAGRTQFRRKSTARRRGGRGAAAKQKNGSRRFRTQRLEPIPRRPSSTFARIAHRARVSLWGVLVAPQELGFHRDFALRVGQGVGRGVPGPGPTQGRRRLFARSQPSTHPPTHGLPTKPTKQPTNPLPRPLPIPNPTPNPTHTTQTLETPTAPHTTPTQTQAGPDSKTDTQTDTHPRPTPAPMRPSTAAPLCDGRSWQ
jgi:hypothetical protein